MYCENTLTFRTQNFHPVPKRAYIETKLYKHLNLEGSQL